MKLRCEIDYIDLDKGTSTRFGQEHMPGHTSTVPSVRATCPRCGHCEESFGTSDQSIKRSLVLLREHCPNSEKNYYVE